jgi:hypothetical protein
MIKLLTTNFGKIGQRVARDFCQLRDFVAPAAV